MNRISELIQDWINLYRVINPTSNYDKSICLINQGSCGVLAMCVGRVLQKEGYAVVLNSHCLHMWLEVDGVSYDSFHPNGYSGSMVDYWLLPDIQYNPNTLMISEDTLDPGFNGSRQDCLVIRAWCLRHGVPEPGYVGRALKHLKGRRFKRYWRRFKKACQLPIHKGEALPHSALPFTHYWHGEFEKDLSRPLKRQPFPLTVKVYKNLFKDAKQGIPVTRL